MKLKRLIAGGLVMIMSSAPLLPVPGIAAAHAAQAAPNPARQLAASCAAPIRKFGKEAQRLGELATLEHKLFHGHEINAEGRLWHFGITETDNTPLDADARSALNTTDQFAWKRIITYWETGVGLSAAPTFSIQNALANMNYLKAIEAAKVDRLSAQSLQKVPRLAEQAAVANVAWSAAFISFLIRQVKLGPEFNYSELHSVFIAEALSGSLGDPSSARGFRACDPASTRVEVGDLLCFTREDGESAVRDFPGLLQTVIDARKQASPGAEPKLPVFAAHCDVVSARDERARTFQVIGGNAWQSVARRTMKLSSAQGVDARYLIPASESKAMVQACRTSERCGNLSRKRYVALLKLR